MPDPTEQVILYLNTMLVELLGLQNAKTLAYVNTGATVEFTLVDGDETEVAGQVWPTAMSYVAASSGDYNAVLADDVSVSVDSLYFAIITAVDASSNKGRWKLPLRVRERRDS